MYRATVLETTATGEKSTRDIFELNSPNIRQALKTVKRRLAKNTKPENRTVNIQITNGVSTDPIYNRDWTIPDTYGG